MSTERNILQQLFDRPSKREIEIGNQALQSEWSTVHMLAQEEFKGYRHLHSLMVGLQHVLSSSSSAYQNRTILQWDSSFVSSVHVCKDISNSLTRIEYEDGSVDRIKRLASQYRVLDDRMVTRLHIETLMRVADLLIMLELPSPVTRVQMADLLRKRCFNVVEADVRPQNLRQPLPDHQSFEFTERIPGKAPEVFHFGWIPVLHDTDGRKRGFYYSSKMLIPQAVQGKLVGSQDPFFGGVAAAALSQL